MACMDCQTKGVTNKLPAGLLQPIPVRRPFSRVGIDAVGPFKLSNSGNKYILTATCYFTKYAEVRAVPDITAETTAKFIVEEIICRHGAVEELLSDLGRNFLAEVVQQILVIVGTRHVRTTSYKPSTNGLDERFNGTLCRSISKYVDSTQKNWDEFIGMLRFAYNTTTQSSTKLSPFMILHGRDVRLPIDVITGEPVNRPDDPKAYARDLIEVMPTIWKIVKENINEAQRHQKRHFDKRHRDVNYEKGSLVWVYKPARKRGMTDKLIHKNRGPYIIVDKYKDVNYIVEQVRGPKKREIVHVSKLSPCYTRDALDSSTEIYFSDNEGTEDEHQNGVTAPIVVEISDTKTKSSESSGTVIYEYDNESDDGIQVGETSAGEQLRTTETPLRRSSRTTKGIAAAKYSPTLLALSILTIAMCLSTNEVNAGFHKVSPILWRHTGKPVLVGVHPVQMAIKFYNPCELLNDPDLLPKGSQAPLYNWCNISFYSDFIAPVRKMCKPKVFNDEVVKIRGKRLVLEIGLGIIAISAAASIGLSAVAITKTESLSDRVNDVAKQNQIMMKNLEQVTSNDLVEKLELKRLKNEISSMSGYVTELSGYVTQMQKTLPTALIVMSKLGAQFVLTRNLLYEISRKWELQEMDAQLFNVFNVTLPCDGNCPLKYAKPKSCSIDEKESLIVIHFDLRVTQPKAHVLAADAFTLVKANKSNNQLCHKEYVGPNLVVYDETQDCIVPTKGTNLDFANDLILKPDEHYCNKRQVTPNEKYWEQNKCEPLDNVIEDEVVQVKNGGDYNFVYCNTLKIKLYEKLMAVDCPDYVFALPANRSFRIGRLSYSAEQIKLSNEMKFIPDLSQRINFQIMPKINNLDLTEDLKITENLIDSIKTDHPEYVFDNYMVSTSVSTIAAVVGIILCAVYYFFIRKRSLSKSGAQTTHKAIREEIELMESPPTNKEPIEVKTKSHKPKGKHRSREEVEEEIVDKV
jgi:hypothetical protein